MYHGIDLDLFSGHENPHPPRQPYRIMTVARLTPKKGIPTILKALASLMNQGIDFEYTLIGDGDDRDNILAQLVELGLQNRCHWAGTLPHDKVIAEFERADLFALGCEIAPNGDRDGIPNVLVESLAMGVPAIGTTVSALPEIVVDQETGLLSPPGDHEIIAGNMLKLLTDEELRQRVIDSGSQHVRSSFDNNMLIHDLAHIYCRKIPGLRC